MELTILLSKVFGIYLLVGGLAYMTRQRYFMAVVHDFVGDRALRMIISVAELIAGLFLVLNHNLWDTWPERIVSLVGWLVVIEGAFYLLMPESVVKKTLRAFNTKGWYVGGGIISILLGIYLMNYGFDFGLF
jgi:hypothetical protein